MSSPVLVGRRDELAQLVDVTDRVAVGQTRIVTLGGDPGVGKTRIIEAAAEVARGAGFRTFSGGCLDVGDGTLPHIAITEALRPLWTDLDPEVLARVVGPVGSDLAALGLGPVDPRVDPGLGRSAGRVLEVVRAVLDRLAAERPVLLVIEDLQWADQSTRDLTLYLSRNLRGPVMLVLSYRSDELHRRPALRLLLAELHRGGRCEHLPLGPLAAADIAEMLGQILGYAPSAELVDEIAARSEGNPFFAEELLAAHRRGSAMSATLRTVLAERLDHLGRDCAHVLALLAVHGAPVTHDLLTELLVTVPADLTGLLRQAVDEHVLAVGPDRQTYIFRHALLRELVYDDLIPGERQQLHARCARVLAPRTWPSAAARAAGLGAVAYHWHRAGEQGPALIASMDAGRAAGAAGAPGDASRHYQRVLELWDKAPDAAGECGADHDTVVKAAALAAHLSGDYRTGARLLSQAVASVDKTRDPGRASQLHEAIAYCRLADGQLSEAREAYDEAARLAPRDPPGPELARALTGQSHLLLLADRNGPAITAARAALEVATSVRAPDIEGRALTVLGAALCHQGLAREGREALTRALEASSAAADNATRIWTLGCIADADLLAGDAASAVSAAGQARALARSIGAERNYGAWFASAAVEAKLWLGDIDGAQGLVRELLDLDPPPGVRCRPLIAAAMVGLFRGALSEAASALDEALDPVIPLDPITAVDGFSLLARVATAQGRYDRAQQAVESGLAVVPESDTVTRVVRLCGAALCAEAARVGTARELGLPEDLGTAAEAAKSAVDMFGRLPGPDALQPLALVTAELATTQEWSRVSGSPMERVGRWRSALGCWERLGFPYPAAHARWQLAQALLAIGNMPAAAATLKTAHRDAVRLGAHGLVDATADLADRARIELVPSGVGATRMRTAAVPDALTAREEQVLGLLAEGMTNRSIAERLYISEKTVSVHVTHVLAKLHVSNRGQAAAVGRRLETDTR